MEFKGYIKNIGANENEIEIVLRTKSHTIEEELIKLFNSNKEMKCEIKRYRQKRSLDANAYFWCLIDKLSEVLKLGRTEIYRKLIKEAGVAQIVPIKNEALEKWVSVWEDKGEGWFCETSPSKFKGYTNVKNYFGTSSYDSKEMSRIVDFAVQECHDQGIETLSDQEINSLIREWGEK